MLSPSKDIIPLLAILLAILDRKKSSVHQLINFGNGWKIAIAKYIDKSNKIKLV